MPQPDCLLAQGCVTLVLRDHIEAVAETIQDKETIRFGNNYYHGVVKGPLELRNIFANKASLSEWLQPVNFIRVGIFCKFFGLIRSICRLWARQSSIMAFFSFYV